MSTTTDSPTSSEAEHEAETARAGLVSTLTQLKENLKPGNMVDEVMTNAKVSASAISDQIWETARANPLPALLIGAGAAMLLGLGGQRAVSSSTRRTAKAQSPTPSNRYPRDPEFRDHVAQSRSMGVARNASWTGPKLDSVRNQASDLLSSANDKLVSAASRGAQKARDAFQSTPTLGDSMTSLSRSRDQLSTTFSRILEEQPLVLAAIGVAVGAALGAAIPQTETENSLMGDTSHSVKDAAQSMMQDQVAQLKTAASHAVDDIKQTVADHGINTDNLSGLVHDVADKAKSATYEAGKSLDPTT